MAERLAERMAEAPAAGDDPREDGCRGSRTRVTVARRLTVAVALCLEVSATLLMTTRLLFGATAGIGLASMGWYLTGHLPPPAPRTDPGRRRHGTSHRRHTGFGFASAANAPSSPSSGAPDPPPSEGPLSGPDQTPAPAGDPRL